MDDSMNGFELDNNGICNFCKQYEYRVTNELPKNKPEALACLVEKIKKDGKNKEFDCIIGVSGGVDSSYIAHLVKNLGLRPLAIHFDNGWNSELAVSNIEKLLKKLNIELYTHVVDWNEFKDLQKSFIKSSINNLEIPTDHGITAILFKMANKFQVKYIINGSNLATEGILPVKHIGRHIDSKLLKSIHKKFGTVKLKTFPKMGLFKFFYYIFIKRIKYIPLLNYIDFVKEDAIVELETKYGWKRYGGKHYESIFTRFYQGYMLPVKYNYDKRKAHLSTLIMSGQISKDEAVEELKKNPYGDVELIEDDKEFVIKKFGFSTAEFENILKEKVKKAEDYPSYEYLFAKYGSLITKVKKIVLKG
tara:strand:+ start:5503 stop:6588 length:1086 start_codon:yes stop_codon:yes gene_type:complete